MGILVALATRTAQQGVELSAKGGRPPSVDDEVGCRVDGEEEVRERDDLLNERCVGAIRLLPLR